MFRFWIVHSLFVFLSQLSLSQKQIENRTIPKDKIQVFPLSNEVKETSGLIYWNNLLWTHNDDNDHTIYGIQPHSGKIESTIVLPRLKVVDWEEIQHDKKYLYLGDFGNNGSGSRSNLRIFKVNKTTLHIDTIRFSYPEQTNFTKQKSNNTSFDCEAFIVTDSMLYLFTKEWNTSFTTLYKIPNKKGTHKAKKISSLKINGLITGAAMHPTEQKIMLCGYTKSLSPFVLSLSNYFKDDFLGGKTVRFKLNKSFLQIEGIAFIDETTIAVTNEAFNHPPIERNPSLMIIDVKTMLK